MQHATVNPPSFIRRRGRSPQRCRSLRRASLIEPGGGQKLLETMLSRAVQQRLRRARNCAHQFRPDASGGTAGLAAAFDAYSALADLVRLLDFLVSQRLTWPSPKQGYQRLGPGPDKPLAHGSKLFAPRSRPGVDPQTDPGSSTSGPCTESGTAIDFDAPSPSCAKRGSGEGTWSATRGGRCARRTMAAQAGCARPEHSRHGAPDGAKSRLLDGESFGAALPAYVTPEFVWDKLARARKRAIAIVLHFYSAHLCKADPL